jgi:transketolase
VFALVVGPLGRFWGLSEFGKSAPFQVLEKEFGYTPEAVAEKANAYLADYKNMRKELCS